MMIIMVVRSYLFKHFIRYDVRVLKTTDLTICAFEWRKRIEKNIKYQVHAPFMFIKIGAFYNPVFLPHAPLNVGW